MVIQQVGIIAGRGNNQFAPKANSTRALGAYGVKDCTCLYLFFSKMGRIKASAKLILNTAIGKIKKRVVLQLYDVNYGMVVGVVIVSTFPSIR